jgi:hypothetical protein
MGTPEEKRQLRDATVCKENELGRMPWQHAVT